MLDEHLFTDLEHRKLLTQHIPLLILDIYRLLPNFAKL
jgi:hypothetical protein